MIRKKENEQGQKLGTPVTLTFKVPRDKSGRSPEFFHDKGHTEVTKNEMYMTEKN